ncbi:HNH endonuclease [Providencia rettgeri]|uniref:HNH endonuclease domain-containing protein n=1 Tax=Providencia rettgeri TaxID=587 RepID=UPI002009E70E|nr:HNH endonuclease domain-containing protein [Providencia rettgeri]UPQ40163.1 HNH endonuclease [Providencia rettgeri]
MIKLRKLPEPARLSTNAANWTQILKDKILRGETPTATEKSRYRHPEIKAILVQETHGKCAYCESKLQHIHHGDVEHIYPKSLDIDKTFEWQNLTLSCEVCNQNKSNKDPYIENIIDPYHTDPEEHLMFIGGLIYPKGTDLGISTRILLKLHRAELVEMRNAQADKIMGIYAQIQNDSLPIIVRKALYDDLLNNEASASAPYSLMAKCIVKTMQQHIDQRILSD